MSNRQVYEVVQALNEAASFAMDVDLETGSHHTNNAAHEEFATKYPRVTAFFQHLNELEERYEDLTEEDLEEE